MAEPTNKWAGARVAEPVFIDGDILFREFNSPLSQAVLDSSTKLIEKPGIAEKIAQWRKTAPAAALRKIEEITKWIDNRQANPLLGVTKGNILELDRFIKTHPELSGLNDENFVGLRQILSEHAPEELKAFDATGKDIVANLSRFYENAERDMAKAATQLLKETDITKIEGYTEANKDAVKKAVDRFVKYANIYGPFGILRTEGPFAALKNSFGSEAWHTSKGKFALKGVGVITGVGMIIDATARGQSKGSDGNPVDRGAAWRIGEGAIGAALALGSALHGGR